VASVYTTQAVGVCSLVGNDTQCCDCVLYAICKTITDYEDVSDTDTAVSERRLVLMARRHVSYRDVSTGAFYRPVYQRVGASYWCVGVPHAPEFPPKVSMCSSIQAPKLSSNVLVLFPTYHYCLQT